MVTHSACFIASAFFCGVAFLHSGHAASIRSDIGFTTHVLAHNDDESTGPVGIGFSINFGGSTYNSLYVNNNGNVTFDTPLWNFSPFSLQTSQIPIIAPFFADVDTRGTSPVTYGTSIIDGRNAFGVNWVDVGAYRFEDTAERNSFQLVMIDRSDLQSGAFDIEFNYGDMEWDTGSFDGTSAARIGWSDGSGGSHEMEGSGTGGTFLNGGPHSPANSQAGPMAVRSNSAGGRSQTTHKVPDGGSSVLLLGLSMLGIHGVRRLLKF